MKKEAEKKEVGFITVINVIVGIIIAVFCVLALIMGLYWIGAGFFVLAAFIFLPQKILKFSKWLKLLICVVGFFVLLAIVGMNLPSQEPEFTSYNLNELFIINYNEVNISMVIYNATKEDKIILNGEERTSEGTFIKVNGALTNLGKSPTGVETNILLMDNQNNSYNIIGYNLGEGALQPNLKRDIFYIFEVSNEAAGLRFIVAEDKTHFKEISLGI
jgi:hypothetical protein